MAVKANATIDLNALKVAGANATGYITDIDSQNGITIKALNGNTTTGNYIKLNANGLEIFKKGESKALYGEGVRIGVEEKANIVLNQDLIVGKGLNGLEYFKFQASSNNIETQITDNVVSNEWASSINEPLILICSNFSSGTINIRIRGMSEEESIETILLFTYGNAVNSSITTSIKPSLTEEATIYYSYNGTNQFSFYSPKLKQKNFTASITGNYIQNRLAPGYALGSGNPSGGYSLIEGYQTSAIGNYSHAEGYSTEAVGDYSHAEGYYTTATPHSSHAEGYHTEASGECSHAEGYYTKSIGNYSHTEGSETKAEGVNAHAGGYRTRANGNHSCTFGTGTVATESNQMAIGQYNYAIRSGDGTSGNPYTYSDAGNYLFIIGNGTGDATSNRKNIFTVDTYGNVNIPSGKKYQINGTALAASDVNAVSTSDVSTTGGANKVIKTDSSGNINLASGAVYKINGVSLIDKIYPVGSIYMSVNSTSPATLFGGTWARITGRFLLAATDNGSSGASQAAGNTGGAATVTLTAEQSGLPEHTHTATIKYAQTAGTGTARYHIASSGSTTSPNFVTISDNTAQDASEAHENMPPYLAVYVWKRTA